MSRVPGAPRNGARWVWCVVATTMAFACAAHASPVPGPPDPGEPVNTEPPKDPEFGVATDRHGLRRSVAMLQWTRGAGGFVRQWSTSPVDASGFPENRENPAFPLPSREWRAEVRVDGRPLEAAVLEALGEWRPLRPDFASLPGNMSATFQPEGDGLGTAANPQAPEVGDLRITWQALHLPPLAGRIVLADGTWRLAPVRRGRGVDPGTPAMAASPHAGARDGWFDWRVVLLALGVLAAVGIAIARRR